MIVRCTQKLFSELKQKPEPEGSSPIPFWSWHANVFYIERRKCVMITNDTTLYTMFIPALKKTDFLNFPIIFGQTIFKNLLSEEIPQNHFEPVLEQCEDIHYRKTNNRSVLGSMNDLKNQLEYLIYDAGGLLRADIYEINRKLNRTPMGAIKHKYPIEILRDNLEKIT